MEAVAWEAEFGDGAEGVPTIAALVDASLVQVESDVAPRYTMLAVIREYALEQLRAAGEKVLPPSLVQSSITGMQSGCVRLPEHYVLWRIHHCLRWNKKLLIKSS